MVEPGRAGPGRAPPDRLAGPRRRRHRPAHRRRRRRRSTASAARPAWPSAWPSSAPRGRIAMVGMPGHVHVDLTGLWQREITLAGAYAYGTEALRRRRHADGPHLRPGLRAGRGRPTSAACVSATYPLDRFDRRRRPRRRRRPPRRGEDRLRPPRREESAPDDLQTRIRPRRRPVDAADPVPPRRAVPAREAARRAQSRSSTRPSRSSRSTTSTAPSATRCSTRIGDSEPLPALLRPGMKLTIAFDDISLPLPPMKRPDIRQRVIEAVLDLAAAAGRRRRPPHRRARPAPPHDRGRAAPRRRRPGLRRLRPPRPALQPRRRGPRQPRLPRHDRHRARRSRSTSGRPRATCSSTSTSTSSPWTAAGRAPPPAWPSYRSLAPPPQRHDHAAHASRSWTATQSELHSSNWRMGKVLQRRRASRSSRSRPRSTTTSSAPTARWPCCRSASGSGRARTGSRFIGHEGRARPDVGPRTRRSIFQAGGRRTSMTSVQAGEVEAVHERHHRATCSSSTSCRSRARPTSSRWGCPTSAPTT